MEKRSTDLLLALGGGLILTLMIDSNSLLAKHSTPLFASWVAYGVGSVAAFLLVLVCAIVFRKTNKEIELQRKIPLWVYLGGIPGAMTVVLAAITVNSDLSLSGSFALMLVGQVLFGICSDTFGFFGTPKKRFTWLDLFVVLLVLTGSGIIIFFKQ